MFGDMFLFVCFSNLFVLIFELHEIHFNFCSVTSLKVISFNFCIQFYGCQMCSVRIVYDLM